MQTEMQNRGVLTAIGIVTEEVIGIGVVVALSAHLPEEFDAAGVHSHFCIITVVDGEVEGDDGVAAVGVGQMRLIGPGGRIRVVIPSETAACNGRSVAIGGMMDCEVEGNDGVAA